MSKTVIVIDKTGRGHSICDAMIACDPATKVHYLPGTAGVFDPRISAAPETRDIPAIVSFCKSVRPDLIFVSHIDYLTQGLADALRAEGLCVFGASAAATRLESSKSFCKAICQDKGVATPVARMVTSRAALAELLTDTARRPFMIKADGLTRNGNGAIAVTEGADAAAVLQEVDIVLAQNPGLPFAFLVEDFVEGFDYSAHFFVNDTSALMLPSSQDFKKSHSGDGGANCDGMGSVSPHLRDDARLNARIAAEILHPVLDGLRAKGISYVGPIYLGLRIDAGGTPHLIEINARMGDSESQTIFPRLAESLPGLLAALASGKTLNRPVRVDPQTCMTITLASGVRRGLDDPDQPAPGDWPFADHGAGELIRFAPALLARATRVHWANVLQGLGHDMRTSAGRIAHITAKGDTLLDVRRRVYASINAVGFAGKRWRPDIAAR